MDGRELAAAVEEECATPLGRLGSDKYLVAATGADLDRGPVLRAAARWTTGGAATFEAWADAASDPASEAFADVAAVEREATEEIAAWLDDPLDPGDGDPETDPAAAARAAMAAAADGPERTGALVGRALVADRTLLQYVSYFVNEGDSSRADRFRELRAAAEEARDAGASLLNEVCDDEDDWDRARATAEDVIDRAYGAYATALEEMGVDPKPVC